MPQPRPDQRCSRKSSRVAAAVFGSTSPYRPPFRPEGDSDTGHATIVCMRKLLHTVLVVIAGLAALCAKPAVAQEDTVTWLDNYQQAIQEGKRTQKPIFLEFRCEA